MVVHGGANALDNLVDQRTLRMVGIEFELHGAVQGGPAACGLPYYLYSFGESRNLCMSDVHPALYSLPERSIWPGPLCLELPMKPAPHPLETTDLSYFWMPFTANRQYKAAPRLLVSAQGMYYRDADGREVLDGTAGLWCVNAGHCRKAIVDAIAAQAAAMDFAPTFQMGHPWPSARRRRWPRSCPWG